MGIIGTLKNRYIAFQNVFKTGIITGSFTVRKSVASLLKNRAIDEYNTKYLAQKKLYEIVLLNSYFFNPF